ncbi:DUF3310 domain-containing protein [Staphylococcus saprophyticus]|nr:DUF3310 domain-containing protein [Staphylococcus saprophyticus]
MKIRDLKIGNYVVVNDLGAGKYSSGMRVIGKVVKIDPCGNSAIIESLPKHRYEITDFNDFEVWAKEIENKTEHIGFVKENTEKSRKLLSNDVKQRKRKEENTALFKIKDLKVGYKVKVLDDNMIGEVSEIADNGKTAEIRVDDAVYRDITDNNDFTILEWNATPQYAEDMVNHPSHYNYGDIEVIDYCDQVCKQYPPELAPYVFNAIKYLSRANHKNGREDIDKAKFYVQRLFDKWE